MNRPSRSNELEGRPLDVASALAQARSALKNAGLASANLDARLLTAKACGMTGEDLIVHDRAVFPREASERLAACVTRRLNGEPASRIIGHRDFWGMRFAISPATLDPRPETELLVETALDFAKTAGITSQAIRILDLGTGTGCVLAALLSELPNAVGVGADMCREALAVARDNLRLHRLEGRAALLRSNWAQAIKDATFDIVVCNPPYIPTRDIEKLDICVRDYDPRSALDGGADGLAAYRILVPQVLRVAKPGRFFAFETGWSQARAVRSEIEACGMNIAMHLRTLGDLSGQDRVVAGVRQSSSSEGEIKKKVGSWDGSGYVRVQDKIA